MPHKLQKKKLFKLASIGNDYQNYPIHPRLSSYVKSIELQLSSKSSLPYNVLPDLSVVMGFQYEGSLFLLEKEGKKRLEQCGISGLQTHYKSFQPENRQTKTVLVKLYPWAINRIFNDDAHYFTGQALGLSEILGNSPIASLKEQLATALESDDLFNRVQNFLLTLLAADKSKPPSSSIVALAQQLSRFESIDSVAKLAQNYHLSQRNLERQFKNVIGLSPKKFLRLSQFQKALYQLRNGANWEQMIEHLNYYDQAHFINSFKEFSGLTPGQFKALHLP